MSSTVDALLPLSFLEAVRSVDAPDDDQGAEFVHELRNKRLGLSETVYAQSRRYADAVKRKQRAVQDEAVALARLVGRRPDAGEVFREAGRYLAREAYLTIPAWTRRTLLALPAFVARPVALRSTGKFAARYLNGTLRRFGGFVYLRVPNSVTLASAPRSEGCVFYEASLHELLRLLIDVGSAVEHTRCVARGDEECEWRAEWR
ncbi:MAG: hypothetical protein WKG32_12615 [Gemmatimonadaceae bacterium]